MNTPTVSAINPEDVKKWDTSGLKDMSAMFENAGFSGDLSNWEMPNEEQMEKITKQSAFIKNAMTTLKDTLGVEDRDAFVMAYAQYQEHQKAQAALEVSSESPSLSNS